MNRFGMSLQEYRMVRQHDRYNESFAAALAAEDEAEISLYSYLLDDLEAEMESLEYEVI